MGTFHKPTQSSEFNPLSLPHMSSSTASLHTPQYHLLFYFHWYDFKILTRFKANFNGFSLGSGNIQDYSSPPSSIWYSILVKFGCFLPEIQLMYISTAIASF